MLNCSFSIHYISTRKSTPMSKNQPKINIRYKTIWKYLDLLSIFFIVFILSYTYTKYLNLPEQIPTHFDHAGNADSYGNKILVWILPVVGIIIFAILYMISKIPHKFNYVVEITEYNAESQYNIALEMMVYMRLIIAMLFSYLTYMIIELALGNQSNMGILPLWILMAVMGIIISRSIYLSSKYK